MSNPPLRPDTDDLPAALDDDLARDVYAAVVVSSDDGDECTIFRVDATEAERVTTWSSAEAGSFVSLAAMR